MKKNLFSVDAVIEKINNGDRLILSGDEKLLNKLPPGNWIGGTIPYFMTNIGGTFTEEKIFVTALESYILDASIKVYDETNIDKVFVDMPANGFSLIIIPASSQTQLTYALNASDFEMFGKPIIGWVSGVNLDQLGEATPKVFNGQRAQAIENGAVVMHMSLPENMTPDIDILNIFEQGDGDVIIFQEDGFSVEEAYVNGKIINFADYVLSHQLDLRLPLVADYSGAMINVSFQEVDKENKVVKFYAPVFRGVAYKHARAIDDYVTQFIAQIPQEGIEHIFFSCNCILNYLFSELEGKKTGGITGPITFGEIAYMLLNQTMVYLNIHEV